MTNYSSYGDSKEFIDVVVEGVKEEWLSNTKFKESLMNALETIYKAATYATTKFAPEPEDILNPFRTLAPSDVNVIVIGQDPYPGMDHKTGKLDAEGYAFHSTSFKVPYSAQRIFKLLKEFNHVTSEVPTANYLPWVAQGVFLVNASFTVVQGTPGSHSSVWENILSHVISQLKKDTYVSIHFGKDADNIDVTTKHKVTHVHPAYKTKDSEFLSKDVFGIANNLLTTIGKKPINWNL